MTARVTNRDRTRLRRMALHAQGLLRAQPFGRGLAGARNAVRHIGYVQIDTISVVERAHHHVLYSRVPGFRPAMVDQMLQERSIFEYWAHAAAFLPMDDFRFSLPYKQAVKGGQVHWYRSRDHKLMAGLMERVRVDGPLRSRDLEPGAEKRQGWWDWKPAKQALEQLYMQGDLMVSDREGFQKTYDLTERVLPAAVDTRAPDIDEFAGHLVDQQLRCHGLVSLKGFTYLRRNDELRRAVRVLIDERVAARHMERLTTACGEVFYVEAGGLEQALPRVADRLLILSPFDNSVIQRDRLRTLFDYDYQIECYLPEAKRRYGYFCLPLLYRDQFVGRMDCKAHRRRGQLEIRSLYFEPYAFDDGDVVPAFADAVARFSQFQGCQSVTLKEVRPQRLARSVRDALALESDLRDAPVP